MFDCDYFTGNALKCIVCDWDASQPTSATSCYDYSETTVDSPSFQCAFTSPSQYCLTQFTFVDGKFRFLIVTFGDIKVFQPNVSIFSFK